MIDYNLYGMSFLHIPNKLVRYRQQTRTPNNEFSISGNVEMDDELLRNVEPNQILDRKIDRMSTSRQEIDFSAAVILNRFQISMSEEENEHANPGIAFLWSDERGRRSKMDGTPPPLITTQEASQDRDLLTPLDSELFHLAALNRRLEQLRADSPSTQSSDSILFDQTLNRSNVNRKFNLNQFLQNSVYPAECENVSQSGLVDASFMIDHLRTMKPSENRSSSEMSTVYSQQWDNVQFDPNETFVDEELILNLTQKTSNQTLLNETLNENEHEVLDIFETLEEDESKHDETLRIDDDSVLAPISQRLKDNSSQHFSQSKHKKDDHITSFEEDDSDDDLLNEFSMSIIDCLPGENDRSELKIPQLDGALDSPKKRSAFKKAAAAVKQSMRSPSKSAKKYTPLTIVIAKSPMVASPHGVNQQQRNILVPKLCLEKCDALVPKTYTVGKILTECRSEQRASTDQNKTPAKQKHDDKANVQLGENKNQQEEVKQENDNAVEEGKKNEPEKVQDKQKLAKNTEVPEKYRDILKKSLVVNLIRYNNIEEIFNTPPKKKPHSTSKKEPNSDMRLVFAKASTFSREPADTERKPSVSDDDDDEVIETTPEREPETERRYPKRTRTTRISALARYQLAAGNKKVKKPRKRDDDELNKMDFWYSWYKWSDCELAKCYDEERNFFPQPGPSNLNYYEDDVITGYYRPLASKSTHKDNEAAATSGDKAGESTAKKRLNSTPPQRYSSQKVKVQKLNDAKGDSPGLFSVYSPILSEDSEEENDIHVQSFYEQSIVANMATPTQANGNAPDDDTFNVGEINSQSESFANTTLSTPVISKFLENLKNSSSELKIQRVLRPRRQKDTCTIKPTVRAPHPNDAKRVLDSHEFPKAIHPVPFYSDPNDVIANNSKKEIGHTVLQLTGNAVADCDEFKSQLNVLGIGKWQRLIGMQAIRCSQRILDSRILNNETTIRKFLAKEKPVLIRPVYAPPTKENVRNWIDMRSKTKQKKRTSDQYSTMNGVHDDADSPEKIRREKAIAALYECDDEAAAAAAVAPTTNGFDHDIMRVLRSNKDLTVLLVSKRTGKTNILKSHSDDENKITRSDNSDDEDDNDVVCLDDPKPSKPTQHTNSFTKLSDSHLEKKLDNTDFRAHLNLDDTIARLSATDTSFGIKGGPMENSFGFRLNLENFQCAKSNIEHNYLTILSLEIHCQTRSALLPDPIHDEIVCIFYEIYNDVPPPPPSSTDDCLKQRASGVLINTSKYPDFTHFRIATQTSLTLVTTETELFMELVRLIRKWDPDIFAGYEIELASWGYVIQRSQVINVDLVPLISRIPSQRVAKFKQADEENVQHEEFMGFEYDSEYKLHGRILLDVWRLLRGEIALTSYSFENIMYHVMHRRCPLYSCEKLTRLWNESVNRWIVIEYYLNRVKGTLEILNQLDLVGRTCELAKLFGIQFYEVLSRGSQFRVESMMLRIAKPKNLIPVSPSVQQRAHMRSPEYLPLILEPHSRFYSDPMIVLDFQSLYPSMIIAYNYCFSTCLGRVEHLGQSTPFELGAWQLRVPRRLIEKLKEKKLINISPCGAVFVKPSVREGVLPRMLREILDTRLMVKQSMKLHKSDKLLQRILHSRQLGLKLMANVTYGYTAANFSGRMPCVEVGDSVVSKGRETLERAIKTVESNKEWGCRVVYGDTDSMFVLVPGRSREEAFRIGAEIADTVTKQNPFPVKLKLEKVYLPSILQTKKRYVGYMYESADQSAATYEAKGIETVRRDGCPAVAKILEKTLRILFETCDVSTVKRYICKQFTKILSGRANVQDLIFAKEFRGVNGYKPGACVPSLELTRAALQVDRRAEPRRGERVPYLVINGPPGVPLIRLVRSPHEYLTNEALKINAIYYITKVLIPPLNRCLLLIGADANQWFSDLPRKSQYMLSLDVAANVLSKPWDTSLDKSLIRGVAGVTGAAAAKKSTISQYFSSTNCVCDCGEHTQNGICSKCLAPRRRQQSVLILTDKSMQLERKLNLCLEMCSSCCGQLVDSKCQSLDCSVLYMLNRWKRESKQIHFYQQLLSKHF
ncbi:DNA polymerase zeta catalytic subunit isoform X2 [Sitodiplosis mosellana]|nr:DNA polymerase zeta catalytic subunit isoform X2 [Sitodiplosis mosellana]